ncbi:peptidylprolyl isomerase [Sphingopyxis sp. QXT-31]|uniref:peptidylprolyl isomerase n=1 Tax=Sphingopyxis sp. QXT-31 TaxID=1357916 RepID=UPI0009790585|nr:peptidylprolyl isomerase [Sphingopyxis sp. QXT-31]APZ98039.1 peptidylprolyl isomerase [Sphingopyxis sp. QXT-31]
MKHRLLAAAAAFAFSLPVAAQEASPPLSPGEIAAAAPASDWVEIPASDLLVMDLAPAGKAKKKAPPRRVVIQLMPAPFSQGWIGNIRKLAAAHWWDGASINRVQDNYVVQWGDATEKKPLPGGVAVVPEADYTSGLSEWQARNAERDAKRQSRQTSEIPLQRVEPDPYPDWHSRDAYTQWVDFYSGWPVATSGYGLDQVWWPVHCYGMLGVGRNLSPDTGNGAELYTVIGHAPRHLDRNIAVVGRVIAGIEHLSSLPRGTGALGFYEKAEERVPIKSIRLATDLPAPSQPKFEYLSTESESFTKYADARANRRDPFFITPAGGADVCNIPVPVRAVSK